MATSEKSGGSGADGADGATSESKSVAVYVCMLPSKRGKFDAEKAKLLGVQQCGPAPLPLCACTSFLPVALEPYSGSLAVCSSVTIIVHLDSSVML